MTTTKNVPFAVCTLGQDGGVGEERRRDAVGEGDPQEPDHRVEPGDGGRAAAAGGATSGSGRARPRAGRPGSAADRRRMPCRFVYRPTPRRVTRLGGATAGAVSPLALARETAGPG